MAWQKQYIRRFYSSRNGWVDGTSEFLALLSRKISPDSAILEVGSGPPNATSAHLAALGEVHGLDVDPVVRENHHLSRALVFDGGDFPVPAGAYDACVSNYVLEHLENPLRHLKQVHRALRPGGVYVFRTPNRFHYVSAAAMATPHWVHEELANRLRGLETGAHTPYPTFHRLNDRGTIRRRSNEAGLLVEELRMVEKEPSYGMSSRLLFLAFLTYERLVNSTRRLEGFRSNIFASLRKADQEQEPLRNQ